jgi:hypothetical protein
MLYSTIDANGDNGNGTVILKNQLLWTDTILSSYVSATRHANGRDWWIIAPQISNRGFHVALVSPEGIQDKGLQLSHSDTLYYYCCGQTAFSPDGTKYFTHLPAAGIYMMDFDRCTGQLSNPRSFKVTTDGYGSGGIAVSPNGRYLYAPTTGKVYQFDLLASDIEASRVTVAEFDYYSSPFLNYYTLL